MSTAKRNRFEKDDIFFQNIHNHKFHSFIVVFTLLFKSFGSVRFSLEINEFKQGHIQLIKSDS